MNFPGSQDGYDGCNTNALVRTAPSSPHCVYCTLRQVDTLKVDFAFPTKETTIAVLLSSKRNRFAVDY